MAALIRFFSRRKKKDKLDSAEQRFFHEGHSPVHEPGKLKFHKNDIECKVIHLDGQEMTTYLPVSWFLFSMMIIEEIICFEVNHKPGSKIQLNYNVS